MRLDAYGRRLRPFAVAVTVTVVVAIDIVETNPPKICSLRKMLCQTMIYTMHEIFQTGRIYLYIYMHKNTHRSDLLVHRGDEIAGESSWAFSTRILVVSSFFLVHFFLCPWKERKR